MSVSEARVRKGPDVLTDLGARLDDLHQATGAPIMARRPWLETWIRCFSDHEPWAISVESDGRLDGAALLALRRRSGLTEVVRLGHWATDHARLPARDDATAAALAVATVAQVRAIRGPWQLHLGQMPVGDPVLGAIAERLRRAVILPGDGSPWVRLSSDRSLPAHVSENHLRNTRKALNRLRREGVAHRISSTREPRAIEQLFPQLDVLRRRRDAEKGRTDKLADPRYAAFRRSVILELAQRGEAELTTIWFDEELAGFNLALLDGHAYRLWDGRMSSKWQRFYPGRLVTDASLESALGESRFREFDFMRGQLQYKLWIAKDVMPSETLVAWSTALTRVAVHSASRVRGAVRTSLGAVRRRI